MKNIYKLDGTTQEHPLYGNVLVQFRRTESGKRKQVVELVQDNKIVAVFDVYNVADPVALMGFTTLHLPGRSSL